MRNLFRTLFILFFVLLLSCRKEEERVIPGGYRLFTSDCTNGIQDGDETGVDCGGSCVACITVDLNCSITNGTISMGGVNYPVGNINPLNSGFSLQTTLGLIIFQFESTPSSGIYQTTTYNTSYVGNRCGIQASLLNDEGTFTVYNSILNGGNLQVTTGLENYTVQFCNVELRTSEGVSLIANLSVTIPN